MGSAEQRWSADLCTCVAAVQIGGCLGPWRVQGLACAGQVCRRCAGQAAAHAVLSWV